MQEEEFLTPSIQNVNSSSDPLPSSAAPSVYQIDLAFSVWLSMAWFIFAAWQQCLRLAESSFSSASCSLPRAFGTHSCVFAAAVAVGEIYRSGAGNR